MVKFTVSIKSCCHLKSLFVLFNPTVVYELLSFLEKSRKHFCDFVKPTRIENSPQHLSAIIYRYHCKKLRFIDYRYRPAHFLNYRLSL